MAITSLVPRPTVGLGTKLGYHVSTLEVVASNQGTPDAPGLEAMEVVDHMSPLWTKYRSS